MAEASGVRSWPWGRILGIAAAVVIPAVLARKPQVALVDEIAHTNAPGSRNEKRHEDVQELLAAGIHVVTTVNIQHMESLYDDVERATGVKVRERVPDRVLLEADQVVTIDLSPEDLRKRLEEGKVYPADRIPTALSNFFALPNLEQLRELTLRELGSWPPRSTRKGGSWSWTCGDLPSPTR
jgi:two-component system sensor histidine kinase KdpD